MKKHKRRMYSVISILVLGLLSMLGFYKTTGKQF